MLIISLLKRIWKIFVLKESVEENFSRREKKTRDVQRLHSNAKLKLSVVETGNRRSRFHHGGHRGKAEKYAEMSNRHNSPYRLPAAGRRKTWQGGAAREDKPKRGTIYRAPASFGDIRFVD
jgi:hypothetical protein